MRNFSKTCDGDWFNVVSEEVLCGKWLKENTLSYLMFNKCGTVEIMIIVEAKQKLS